MNPLDILLILSIILLYGIILFTNFKFIKALMLVTIILDLALIIQIIKQGLLWNYSFLYFTVFILMPLLLVLNSKNRTLRFMKLFKVISTFLVILTAFLIYAFPVPKLTTPLGKYAIGTTLYDLSDSSRIETYSDLANANRKFMFQVWYPAESVKGYKKAPWLIQGEATTKGLARLGNLPEFALNQLSLVPSNSYFNAPIASESEKYPVLILSHGWSSSRLLHANIAESLASNGYIVIGIEHTFGSVATTFTDGATSFFSSKTLPSTDYSSELLENGSRLIKTFAADIAYVINSLDDFNKGINGPDVLKGKLDLDKIGLIGHSTGGGAAVLNALHDDRIKSILAFDPWVEPLESSEISVGLDIPTLFLRSDEWYKGTNDQHLLKLVQNTSKSSLYQVHDSAHSDFTLMYLFTPLTKQLHRLGKIDGDSLSNLQGELSVAFFNHNLLGIENDTMDPVIRKYPFLEKIQN